MSINALKLTGGVGARNYRRLLQGCPARTLVLVFELVGIRRRLDCEYRGR